MASQITSLTLFTQPYIQAQIKENNKTPRHWPLCRGIHRSPVNSPQKWPVTRKMFHWMTSSWNRIIWNKYEHRLDNMLALDRMAACSEYVTSHIWSNGNHEWWCYIASPGFKMSINYISHGWYLQWLQVIASIFVMRWWTGPTAMK